MSGMSDDTARQYLLRRLDEAEADLFEERILTEDECADRLHEAEIDLLDDYAAERLLPDERDAVERYLLNSPEGEQRLRFARALAATARQPSVDTSEPEVPATARHVGGSWRLRRWMAPVGVLLAASVAFAVMTFRTTQAPVPGNAASGGNSGVAPRPVEPPSVTRPPEQAAPYDVLLLAEVRRGADSAERVAVPPATEQIRLQLEVADDPGRDDASSYRIAVRTAEGEESFVATALTSRQVGALRIVESVVPARVLGAGARHVTLSRTVDDRLVTVFDWEIDLRTAVATP